MSLNVGAGVLVRGGQPSSGVLDMPMPMASMKGLIGEGFVMASMVPLL